MVFSSPDFKTMAEAKQYAKEMVEKLNYDRSRVWKVVGE